MVDLFDPPVAKDMSEVEVACLLAGRGSPDRLTALLLNFPRALSDSDRLHIAFLVRGDYSPGRGRQPNELKPSYLTPPTAIQSAVAMVLRIRGQRRFARGQQTEAFEAAAIAFGVTVEQVSSAYRRRK